MDQATLSKLLADNPAVAVGEDGMTVITGPVRLSFVHFDKPHVPKGSNKDPRYSCAVIVPAQSSIDLLKIACQKAWSQSPLAGSKPKMIPFKPQDAMLAEGYEGFGKGGIYFNTETKTMPDCFDAAMNKIDPAAFYSGCWARIKCRAAAYDVSGNNGVKLWLQGAQFIADDSKFAGSSSDGFGPVSGVKAPAQLPGNGAADYF